MEYTLTFLNWFMIVHCLRIVIFVGSDIHLQCLKVQNYETHTTDNNHVLKW